MILAYAIEAQDDDSYMLGEDTYKSKNSGGFSEWRFGKNGMHHPATCPTCGRKIDPNYVNDRYRVKKRKRDITATYDGYLLVSSRFRQICIERGYQGVDLVPLRNDSEFFWLRSNRIVEYDAKRRHTRFEKCCTDCGGFFDVIGATPIYLRNVDSPLGNGFYRTDIEFASGHEQHAILMVGPKTGDELRALKLSGLEFLSVTDE